MPGLNSQTGEQGQGLYMSRFPSNACFIINKRCPCKMSRWHGGGLHVTFFTTMCELTIFSPVMLRIFLIFVNFNNSVFMI